MTRMATTVKRRRTLAKAGVITGLVLGGLFAGLPVLWMLSTSFKAVSGPGRSVPPPATPNRTSRVRSVPVPNSPRWTVFVGPSGDVPP